MVTRDRSDKAPLLAEDVLRHGITSPIDPPTELRAGPVVAYLDGIDLRGLAVAGSTMLDRVYVAVRDKDWNTIPVEVSELEVRQRGPSFEVAFQARHIAADIDYAWKGTIVGRSDGVVTYTMSGQTLTAFPYSRIGFCLLHPDSLAGATYEAGTPRGQVTGSLPRTVAPQVLVDGVEQALFEACDSLVVKAADGTTVSTDFSGDLFEMEDQRNWTDASFKTYCTPMALGYPHQARAGQHFEQTVTIRVARAQRQGRPTASQSSATLTLSRGEDLELPAIGLGMASDHASLTDRESTLLKHLAIRHLRIDVHPSQHDWRDALDVAMVLASTLDVGLEVALYVPRDQNAAIAEVGAAVVAARVSRWLLFEEETAGTDTTPSALGPQARAILGSDAVIAGGTDGDFAELNRSWPDLSSFEAVTYAINPRVHASDDRSLMDNSTAQGATVMSARSVAPDRSICVSPVTLAPRFNPAASGPESFPSEGELPPQVDVRQLSLFAAAWTVSSISGLAGAGTDSVTYYETVGWRGLLGRESGSPMPGLFPSTPGWAFPVFHVVAQLGRMRQGQLLTSTSTSPRSLAGIAVRREDKVIGMAANLLGEERSVAIGPFDGSSVRIRTLDETTALQAGEGPQAWVVDKEATVVDGLVSMALRPYATVMFEAG